MIEAQEWYEYQKQYQKYGIDMKPESERIPVRERRKEKRRAVDAGGHVLEIKSGHSVWTAIILVIVCALLIVVTLSSLQAKLTSDIDEAKAENDVISGEIEDLDVQLLSSSTITYIEGQAKDKLKMKNPDAKHRVYINTADAPEKGFADILKEKAYD